MHINELWDRIFFRRFNEVLNLLKNLMSIALVLYFCSNTMDPFLVIVVLQAIDSKI